MCSQPRHKFCSASNKLHYWNFCSSLYYSNLHHNWVSSCYNYRFLWMFLQQNHWSIRMVANSWCLYLFKRRKYLRVWLSILRKLSLHSICNYKFLFWWLWFHILAYDEPSHCPWSTDRIDNFNRNFNVIGILMACSSQRWRISCHFLRDLVVTRNRRVGDFISSIHQHPNKHKCVNGSLIRLRFVCNQ